MKLSKKQARLRRATKFRAKHAEKGVEKALADDKHESQRPLDLLFAYPCL
jgi:hypothetical protein